jgi:tRNA U34 2-thiouridine synthase MnmA/TrmU
VCSVVLTVNSQKKSIKSHTKPIKMQKFCHFIGFVCDFIDFLCEFTIKTTEHIVASYKNSENFCPEGNGCVAKSLLFYSA